MKKLIFALFVPISMLFFACGNDETKNEDNALIPQGMVAVDLSEYGILATILVPDSTVAPLEISGSSNGEVEIIVGTMFQIVIADGGDIALKKSDLEGDLLFKSSIVTETPNSIIYKQDLPDGSMSFNHFYAVTSVNGRNFEIKDVDSGESLPQKAIEKMLESANSLKAKAKV